MTEPVTTKPAREGRVRSDGERSRRAILDAAVRLATIEGLDGISIGRLARATGMSKSGLFAHFGSKQELQLATVGTAEAVFATEVVEPAMTAEPGLDRLRSLCEAFLSHVERDVFPGGCFFAGAAAELDTRPGPVREQVVEIYRRWSDLLEGSIREAQERGELPADLDAAQLRFELHALLLAANQGYVLTGDASAFARAQAGIDRLLAPARAARPS